MRAGARAQNILQNLDQRRIIGDTIGIGLEAWIGGQFRLADDAAQRLPEFLLGCAKRDIAIGSLKHAIGR